MIWDPKVAINFTKLEKLIPDPGSKGKKSSGTGSSTLKVRR
jgi:hypothetical protein